MRKLLLLVIAVCVAGVCRAATYDRLTVHLNDGSKVEITLAEGLALTFDPTYLVASGIEAEVTVEKSKIAKFTHSKAAGIGDVTADNGGMTFEGSSLNFSNLPEGSTIAVYAINGATVSSTQASGDYTLSVDGLAAGVYVVKVNNMSYKISVK